MSPRRIIIVGGGAAGFFAAIHAARLTAGRCAVLLLERGPEFLTKVRISGGGRCNVTHACFDPREFTTRYPRGARALIAPFHRFQARDCVDWFQQHGVELKTEPDGRMFPITNSSLTIVDCLMRQADRHGVELRAHCGVEAIAKHPDDTFTLTLSSGETMSAHQLLLATGGCRAASAGKLAQSLGHTIEPPVPSLFTFVVELPWLRALPGQSVESAALSIPGTTLKERGPLLITHVGLSGPGILRLSAWGARTLHEMDYRFSLCINWLPQFTEAQLREEFQNRRTTHAQKLVRNSPLPGLSTRLWEALIDQANLAREARWPTLTRQEINALVEQLLRCTVPVTGKSLNKDEFVTCGGVRLSEVDFKTMQSRLCLGLHFAGELLDIDGITGGFNFQAAWTTGWLAAHSMAELSTA